MEIVGEACLVSHPQFMFRIWLVTAVMLAVLSVTAVAISGMLKSNRSKRWLTQRTLRPAVAQIRERQRADALAGNGENRVGDRRKHRRKCGFAQARWRIV